MRAGEPPITRRAAHNSGTGNKPPRRVVIHATCPGVGYPAASKKGAASGTAKYFQMQSSGGSAHYIYDSSRHEEHCVPENTIAWHAPPNPHTIGIEICGEASYTREQWLSSEVWPAVEEAAARTRELCLRYDLPMRKLTVAQVRAGAAGVCGHVDVSLAFRQTDHSDPGRHFPWDEFMHLVNSDGEGPDPVTSRTEDIVNALPVLSVGADCYDVKTVRALLFARGGLNEKVYGGAVGLRSWQESTKYDAALSEDVKAFQRRSKLADDGVVGPLTYAALLRVS
ncbi:N-acetylmuramoyl-L-alanine amidase [Nonomuraea sp. NPDC050227]|uniref:N-acetylmuramoyl-L-alanine amidase n=1 Tax=Nonomuraea sp. NPDC050227 TaxID=3364360 RepID=UPI003795058C